MALSSLLPQIACEKFSCHGPQVAFAAGCIIDGVLYIQGGVSEARSAKPQANLYKLVLSTQEWQLVSNLGPALSHHACTTHGSQHILFIGGWNGKERTSEVHIYNCQANTWARCNTGGFPVGAGLSSHTASLLSNGEILVVGREGSLRMQRRSGNAFILSGSIAKRQFTYRELPLSVASRSGHTTSSIKNTVVIVGGRNDRLFEIHKMPHASSTSPSLSNSLGSSIPVMPKLPCGRKHHSATVLGNYILIFGGETFDGRSKEPVSELYIIDTKENFSWKSLGKTSVGRAGHTAVIYNNSVVIHGGVGERNIVSNLTLQLKVS